ncbi:MAG: stage V sporulation protein AD [Butyricicoccus sp.]|nr:stage V sporulation protein AD [Butyricicoccus sp.]
MIQKIGRRTLAFENMPRIRGHAAIVGRKEGAGPLGKSFDLVAADTHFGQNTWELAEAEMQKQTIALAVQKSDLQLRDLDLLMAGDLLNQCIGSSIASVASGVPFAGLYGACSTMAEGLALGACMIEGGAAERLCAAASSHFCSAERQYRYPLAYGGQRTPTAQWTATAAGAAVLDREGDYPVRITHAILGRMVEMGVTDANNMGAAMAPAAFDTLSALLQDLNAQPADFDRILTGDLGNVGGDLLVDLFQRKHIDITPSYGDCGSMLYREKQDVHAGGSGCGCSAAVLCGDILRRMAKGEIGRIIFAGTGALMSPTSVQQGQPIAGVCHAVILETQRKEPK